MRNQATLRCSFSWVMLMVGILGGVPSALLGQEEPRWQVTPDVNALDAYTVTPNSTALAKAISDAAEFVLRWNLPKNSGEWQDRKPIVKGALLKSLGLESLPERTALNPQTLGRFDMGDYVLERVIFYSRPEFPVTANLYRPKSQPQTKCPAIVCPVGHDLAEGKAARANRILCIKFAKLGFVVLTYDAIGVGERLASGNSHQEAGFGLLPLGQTISGWMVWDSMRAIDYLLTLPEVDPMRIGITGKSGGGFNSLFTSALDERVRAAAVVASVLQFNNWMKHGGPHCTCVYLPALYQEMEWFEIAGLLFPRPLLMIQGGTDPLFPISGARHAAWDTEALYALLGAPGLARFDEFPRETHGYPQPFRESAYGWMLCHLKNLGDGRPIPEGEIRPLSEKDCRLICDKQGTFLGKASSVLDIARGQAKQAVLLLPPAGSEEVRQRTRLLVRDLTAPPERFPHNLMPQTFRKTNISGGLFEKVFFLSEDGQDIPGLLWKSNRGLAPHPTVIIVDDRGKAAVAQSGLIDPLLERGFAVLSVDLRGRGETLGRIGNQRDNNYQFVVHSMMWGRPVAGRRAFDLKRTVDFVQGRQDLSMEALTVVGFGDDALPALLAAADDARIKRLTCVGFYNSFASQVSAARASSREEMLRTWYSSGMDWGRLDNGSFRVDLGSVVPSILLTADIPDVASLIAPRKLLYCETRDNGGTNANLWKDRFRRVLEAAEPDARGWAWYYPERPLTVELLLRWLVKPNGGRQPHIR
jgi:cephalosporin-C deacetylase-like acetyl esterase